MASQPIIPCMCGGQFQRRREVPFATMPPPPGFPGFGVGPSVNERLLQLERDLLLMKESIRILDQWKADDDKKKEQEKEHKRKQDKPMGVLD